MLRRLPGTLGRAAVVTVVALLLASGTPASAQDGFNPQTCLQPDLYGPVFYEFVPGPSNEATQTGTLLDIVVDDRPYYPFEDAFANWINLVEVSVDDGPPIRMDPSEGHHRKVWQRFTVVLDPVELPPGYHALNFRGRDDCAMVGTHVEHVFVPAPGVVATCALPVHLLCF